MRQRNLIANKSSFRNTANTETLQIQKHCKYRNAANTEKYNGSAQHGLEVRSMYHLFIFGFLTSASTLPLLCTRADSDHCTLHSPSKPQY